MHSSATTHSGSLSIVTRAADAIAVTVTIAATVTVSTHPQSAVPTAAATAGRAIDGTTQEEDRRKTEEDRRKTEESSVFP